MESKLICPKCKQKSGVSISYGFPGDEMQEEAERNEIVLGGCVQEEGAPEKQCLSCGNQWSSARRFHSGADADPIRNSVQTGRDA